MSVTKPTNDLIRIAQNTQNLPSTGKANKQLPSYTLRTSGYDDDQFMSAEEINYTLDNLGEWSQYLIDETDRVREVKVPEVESRISDLENLVTALTQQVIRERVSVGEIIEITGDNTNPSILKGNGTWESFGEGQVLVGVGSHTDDRGESKTWTDGASEGEYRHVQTEAELATHYHTFNSRSSDNNTDVEFSQGGEGGTDTLRTGGSGVGGKPRFINDTGNSSPMNNTQPSIAVYRWKRTA